MLYLNTTFSLSLMYRFILLLITREVIQSKMIVTISPESDETTWTGITARFPGNMQPMYVLCLFNLDCVST